MTKYKVKNTYNYISDNKTTSEIDLFSKIDSNLELTASQKKQIRNEVGEFLIEQTLSSLAASKSPLGNIGSFEPLSPEYRKKKKAEGLPGKPNIERSGKTKNSLTYRPTANGIEIGHFKKSEAGIADGHNNFSGFSPLPKRRYLPDVGGVDLYTNTINKEIARIINNNATKKIKIPKDIGRAPTKEAFWLTLRNTFPGFTEDEIKEIIKEDDEYIDAIKLAGLLKWLK